MMIAKITRAFIRHYGDSGSKAATAEFVDVLGRRGLTQGAFDNLHMVELFARAGREGISIEYETWN